MPVNYSQQELDRWVAEAEQGYDVAELKKRGRGRPGRASEPSQVVTVRLTQQELDSLDKLAAQKHISRSDLLRQAITLLTAA